MDTARYVVAVVVVAFGPPTALFWILVHPLAASFRRVGTVWTWVLAGGLMLAEIAVLVAYRDRLVGRDLGLSVPLVVLGTALLVASLVMLRAIRRRLTMRTLMGGPELTEGETGELQTAGIYARIRHPRYAQILLTLVACALFANYSGAYVMAAVFWVMIQVVVLLEEAELRRRFGGAYDDYARRVPRFLPRLPDTLVRH